MNQSHRLGWPGLARFIADEHPSDRKPCVTPRRVDETEFFRATQRALDKPPVAPSTQAHAFNVGDRVRLMRELSYDSTPYKLGTAGTVVGYDDRLNRTIVKMDVNGVDAKWADPLKWLELIPAQPSTGSGADVFRGPYYDPSNPPDADGWVKHDGSSECPLPPHTRCQILMFGQTTRDGSGFTDLPASDWFWIPVTYYRVVQP